MKKLFKSMAKISLLTFLFALNAWATSPIGVVTYVDGNVFKLQGDKTVKVYKNDYIYDYDQFVTELDAKMSYNDYFDHSFYLAGSSHIRVLKKITEVKSGYLWVKAHRETTDSFLIQTANAATKYKKGEVIVSYDQYSGKSQLLAVKGDFHFSNAHEEMFNLMVPEGKFSFIHKDYNNGNPRSPTPIGYSSFERMTGLFNKEQKEDVIIKPKKVQRAIASTPAKYPGKIIYYNTVSEEVKKEKQNNLMNYHQNKVAKTKIPKVKKVFKPDYSKKSGVTVKIWKPSEMKKRAPASIKKPAEKSMVKVYKPAKRAPASIHSLNSQVSVKTNAFESSLVNEYKKQKRHSNEVNQLINDLKSYDQDYSQSY